MCVIRVAVPSYLASALSSFCLATRPVAKIVQHACLHTIVATRWRRDIARLNEICYRTHTPSNSHFPLLEKYLFAHSRALTERKQTTLGIKLSITYIRLTVYHWGSAKQCISCISSNEFCDFKWVTKAHRQTQYGHAAKQWRREPNRAHKMYKQRRQRTVFR